MKLEQLEITFRHIALVAVTFLGFLACREPFDPEIPQTISSVLVVEGYLDTEGLESELKISRTVPLNSSTSSSLVVGARVTVFSENGTAYSLTEGEPGIYLFSQNIPENATYRILIELRGGERFESLPIRPIVTPDILDAGFVKDENRVEVYVNTKGNETADDFLWTFEETWIYRPRIRTAYIYDSTIRNVRNRTEAERISLCFKSEQNPGILLETSSRFQDQVVFRKTITEIPTGNERIQERYSILISQKAIDADAVKFWETLKRNTEDIGSIFSPLPSQITGNIRSLDNPATPVVGQISMGVIKQKRIYINLSDVSPWGYRDPQFNNCVIGEDLVLIPAYQAVFGSGGVLPGRELMEGTTIIGYFPVDRRCADCTLYASPIVPDFWEND
ncbi:DUF4249 domain-containing protein [Algoriphagus sp.]|uniref:DUF4249 domain-containing protein n=1 Tax=Algoriphagus sp. TaxID=1872435 RepID=UPI00391A28DA